MVFVETMNDDSSWGSFDVMERPGRPDYVPVAAYANGFLYFGHGKEKPLTADIAIGGYKEGWKQGMTLRASKGGNPVLTSNPCLRPRHTDNAIAYLIFAIGKGCPFSDANVYTYIGKAVRIFAANRAESKESVKTDGAVFCFYKDGDVLYVISGDEEHYWERYFVCKEDGIRSMPRDEYAELYPEECNDKENWTFNI